VASCLAVALLVPSVTAVFDVLGATAASACMFTIPALVLVRVRREQWSLFAEASEPAGAHGAAAARQPSGQPGRIACASKLSTLAATVLLASLGGSIAVVGTYLSLKEL
jgi:hypothetical protein